ncbi:HigA family addiction module antitoxin [Cupriavidus plantarum]|uniref:HigA family addiction module antitoxin n=1 Tax=Cupriavidus plantarum TaxID=942865 RepID=UPI00339D8D57
MAKMFNPPHPGALIKDVMTSLNLNVSIAAEQLGISRVQLSRVINARASISTEMAVRLEQWIGGPAAETWLGMQTAHDLWQLRHSKQMPRVAKAKKVSGRAGASAPQ